MQFNNIMVHALHIFHVEGIEARHPLNLFKDVFIWLVEFLCQQILSCMNETGSCVHPKNRVVAVDVTTVTSRDFVSHTHKK